MFKPELKTRYDCVELKQSRLDFRFFSTVIEFLKLEKVEIGGLKGRQLSGKITAIYTDFNQYFSSFASKTYDVLDPDDATFDQDFAIFQQRILDLDMKLAAVLCQAFDDCHNLESVFKLISIVGSVLDRPKIKEEFTNKYSEVLDMLDEEITGCEKIYEHQISYKREHGYLFTDRNMPAVTASLRWIRQLSARVSAPVKQFQVLQHPISKCEQALKLYERYETLMKALGVFEETTFSEWTENVPGQIEANLKKSLINRRKNDNTLLLNFSPELFAILREVHYLKLMGKDGMPDVGIEFAEKNDMYRGFTLNLEKTIDWYNTVGTLIFRSLKIVQSLTSYLKFQIIHKSTKVELKLIRKEIDDIDKAIETGVSELSWNSSSEMNIVNVTP